ncbi:hypothetical protein [Modestobacter sp. KNN46-3]|uniref:hypothetical protein n=1 Tax=Modestobacter sp. KNN46-3 TaxID=2711218 RepID=UPI0013DF1D5E|nr:hypothetical protein [Modestobacter sp. KNN46-3]
MSTVDLTPIKARLAAATPGPWSGEYHQWDQDVASHVTLWVAGDDADGFPRDEDETLPTAADVDLFEHAPADLAALTAEVERLRAQVAELLPYAQAGAEALDYREPYGPVDGHEALCDRADEMSDRIAAGEFDQVRRG